ncbi:M23 family metallopeptidase [Mycolicibacterium sp.]|uniref:M23 family metallopeptidase n=1 Tax=Mycolicibacterium sp. TaxID=2320850 RepID=UPI003D0AB685
MHRAAAAALSALLLAVGGPVLGSCSATSPVTPSPVTAPQSVPAPEGGQVDPLLTSTLSTPRWFTGTDDKTHLVYELMLTNVVAADVTLSAVEVHDAGSGTLLMRLTGDELRAATSLAASADTPTATLTPSAVAVVWLDVPLADPAVPAAVTHRLVTDPPTGIPGSGIAWTFIGPAVEVDRTPPVVLGPPLTGPGWAALGSCCDGPHRRAPYPIDGRWYLAQRFAIDFNQLDEQNRPGVGDPLSPRSFPTFGQPAYAVADGTVVAAVDGDPDLRVGEAREEPTPANAGGNRVVIDIGDGRFAIYAHLRRGSVTVRSGDTVSRGDRIAEVGSSGTSGGPHLHFQVSNQPSVVAADGLPYVFDSFDLTGQTPPLPEVLRYYDTLEPIPVSAGNTGPRRDQLPLGRDVVTFPPIEG